MTKTIGEMDWEGRPESVEGRKKVYVSRRYSTASPRITEREI